MIQELLGGHGGGVLIGGGGERKISMNGGGIILQGTPSLSPSPSPSSSTSTTNTTTNTTTSSDQNQNLRCPRCDSSNTKFCYYNNYNLTQPRHFCKTCRRYWTKGGALRNVPIGGGCRKNKSSTTSMSPSSVGKSTAKVKTLSSDLGTFNPNQSNPAMWASPQNSHLLALIRATQNQNQNHSPLNPNPNSVTVKEEGNMFGSHMICSESSGLSARTVGFDSLSQVPSMGHSNSFWRNNQQQQNGFLQGHEVQNSGIQELYQRLRLSANYYGSEHTPAVVLSNVGSSSSSSILESAPVYGGSELSYWNPAYTLSDLPTTNGAYP